MFPTLSLSMLRSLSAARRPCRSVVFGSPGGGWADLLLGHRNGRAGHRLTERPRGSARRGALRPRVPCAVCVCVCVYARACVFYLQRPSKVCISISDPPPSHSRGGAVPLQSPVAACELASAAVQRFPPGE